MLWRAIPQLTLLAAIVVALLMQVGVVHASAVPGVAHLAQVRADVERWSGERARIASCRYRLLAALSSSDLQRIDLVQRECSEPQRRANIDY